MVLELKNENRKKQLDSIGKEIWTGKYITAEICPSHEFESFLGLKHYPNLYLQLAQEKFEKEGNYFFFFCS